MFDTDQLRSFIAIVDTGSFTRAAQRVNKTQSAVSMHIRRLEERLGKALFIKAGRGARLSEHGEKLTEFARAILQTEAAAVEAVTGKGLSGQIRFGIPDDYADAYFTDIMKYFAMRHPLAEMLVISENSSLLIEQVRSGDLDIALITIPEGVQDVEVLLEEPLCWVAVEGHGAEQRRPLPVALGSKDCEWRNIAVERLVAAGIPAKYVLVSRNYAAVSTAVTAGLAVSVLPHSIVPRQFRVVSEKEGLPAIGTCRIGLITSPTSRVEGLKTLASLIREIVSTFSERNCSPK